MGKQWETLSAVISEAPPPPHSDCSHEIKTLVPWKKSYDQPRQHIKKQRHYFTSKGLSSQSCGFSSSLVWMWDLGYKESWVPKNWRFWTVVLEKTLESPLDCKEIKPVNPKGNQSWIFIVPYHKSFRSKAIPCEKCSTAQTQRMDLETQGAVGSKALVKVLRDEVSGGQAHPGAVTTSNLFSSTQVPSPVSHWLSTMG